MNKSKGGLSSKIAVTLLALALALGIAFVPAEDVNAEACYMDLYPGDVINVNFKKYEYYWIHMTPEKDGNYLIWSEGGDDPQVTLYNPDMDSIGYNDDIDETDNFRLYSKDLKAGVRYTYCIKRHSDSGKFPNNTVVYFRGYTDFTVLADRNDPNDNTFPDAAFKSYVFSKFDADRNGKIEASEAAYCTEMNISGRKIASLKGIEIFSDLEKLVCCNTGLTGELDLSKNKKLKYVDCSVNEISKMNVAGCQALEELDCGWNSLTSLDLKNMKALKEVYCGQNSDMTGLNVEGCTSLTNLECDSCMLETLSLKTNKALTSVSCNRNMLGKLDLSGLEELTKVDCSYNKLTSLNIKGLKQLISVDAGHNQLTGLDLTGCDRIYYVHLDNNQIESLDVSMTSRLGGLFLSKNKLTSLNVKGCLNLATLYCDGNSKLKTLDISDNVFLSEAYDEANYDPERKFYVLDGYTLKIDSTTAVKKASNDIVVEINKDTFPNGTFRDYVRTYIDKDGDGKLDKKEIVRAEAINVSGHKVTSLKGIEYFTELKSLLVRETGISSFDIGSNTKLTILDCSGNNISKLDISRNTKLQKLICSGNKLTDLDLGKNTSLRTLECQGNNITKLDISACDVLLEVKEKGTKSVSEDVVTYKLKKYDNEQTLKYDDKVKIGTVSLKLDKTKASLKCASSLTLKAALKGAEGTVTWKSSDTKTATVDSKGKITAKQAGSVTITASAAGLKASCKITVLYKDVTDTSDFWYAPTNYLTAAGVVKGYDKQTLFKPSNNCTRAQMVTFLYRLQGEPKTKSSKCKFTDVKSTDYFYKPVIWAVEQGITTGYSGGLFKPQNVCTRAQTVTFLWRMAGKPAPKTKKNNFSDVTNKDYFYTATIWASEMKILAGYDDGTFQPQGKCLRRQMVTFLYKYDKYVNGKG